MTVFEASEISPTALPPQAFYIDAPTLPEAVEESQPSSPVILGNPLTLSDSTVPLPLVPLYPQIRRKRALTDSSTCSGRSNASSVAGFTTDNATRKQDWEELYPLATAILQQVKPKIKSLIYFEEGAAGFNLNHGRVLLLENAAQDIRNIRWDIGMSTKILGRLE